MANVALLRMKGKLDALWPKAEAQTAGLIEETPLNRAGEVESAGAHQ
jgi:hypothetical protein